jgi:putative transposon-encoded protein
MGRTVETKYKDFRLIDKNVDVVLDRIINKVGESGKADVPKKYIGKRAYVVVMK